MTTYRKKLIEVALPLEAINKEAAREKSIRHGHPSTLHLWWARRPLAAARAVLFGQLVDDPSSWPGLFKTEEAQETERQRLFKVIADLVLWDNSNNEAVINAARLEIARSHARSTDSPKASAILKGTPRPEVVNAYLVSELPPVYDPFAGGGTIPLEAQRLGLRSIASDLNPVAVMINKGLIEIPPKFANRPPVNPEARKTAGMNTWKGAQGLAEDVRFYGKWLRDEAFRRIGNLYPEVELPKEHGGGKTSVIAWLWARTVASPNPAFKGVHVPLVSNFFLSTKEGMVAWVEPIIEDNEYRFEIRTGKPKDRDAIAAGTKLGRGANFRCLMSNTPIEPDYIKAEGKAGRMGARLIAVVAEAKKARIYLPPTPAIEKVAMRADPTWKPEVTISGSTQYLGVKPYGMEQFSQVFTNRQLVALTTFSDIANEIRDRVKEAAILAGLSDDGRTLAGGGVEATAYGDAVAIYLAFAVSKAADRNSSLCFWESPMNRLRGTFGRQVLPMVWDYAETNPFAGAGGDIYGTASSLCEALDNLRSTITAKAEQADACSQSLGMGAVVSTDPPYYDNVPYADLSDFFYVWMRRSLKPIYPDLFATVAVPKAGELVAFAYRHSGKAGAEAFFLDGMTQAMHRLAEQTAPGFPLTIYYAFKQTENDGEKSTASTGWETFLEAVIRAGFGITGTWPMRTELTVAIKKSLSALASSIVLVCRRRDSDATAITRRDFLNQLRSDLPGALAQLQRGNIPPVDVAQASIGPGMAIFSRYSKVLEADGSAMSVRSALQLINEALDEYLNHQEGEVDSDTRFAITWFEGNQFGAGAYGDAETLAKARNVSVSGVDKAGIIHSAAGKVRLLKRSELPEDWDPTKDDRLTVWEATQHLIKRLEEKGEQAAAELVKALGGTAEKARDLAYRLYSTCERKGWADEARAYNGLVIAWPELEKLAQSERPAGEAQGRLL